MDSKNTTPQAKKEQIIKWVQEANDMFEPFAWCEWCGQVDGVCRLAHVLRMIREVAMPEQAKRIEKKTGMEEFDMEDYEVKMLKKWNLTIEDDLQIQLDNSPELVDLLFPFASK